MQYLLIIIIVIIGIVSFLYPKIKKIIFSSTVSGSREDYLKLKKDIENAIERDDESLEPYDALYSAFIEYNELLRKSNQDELTGELPLSGKLYDFSELMEIKTIGSLKFPVPDNILKRKRRLIHRKYKRTYPIYLEASKLHLNAGFCLLPMSYIPLGEETSMTILYGLAKESLLESGAFGIKRGDKLVLDTIFDTFTYIVSDIGAIEESDIEYMKAKDDANELMIMFFTPNQAKRFCAYATLEQE